VFGHRDALLLPDTIPAPRCPLFVIRLRGYGDSSLYLAIWESTERYSYTSKRAHALMFCERSAAETVLRELDEWKAHIEELGPQLAATRR